MLAKCFFIQFDWFSPEELTQVVICLFVLVKVVWWCLAYWVVNMCSSVVLSIVKWLAVKNASEMTYTVSSGALNSTQTKPNPLLWKIHRTTVQLKLQWLRNSWILQSCNGNLIVAFKPYVNCLFCLTCLLHFLRITNTGGSMMMESESSLSIIIDPPVDPSTGYWHRGHVHGEPKTGLFCELITIWCNS